MAELSGPSAALVGLVVETAAELATHADLLNTLDGLAGDGDLGVTATHAAAALAAIAADAAAMEPGAALRRMGRAIASGAPSTGGTLIAFAFMAAGGADIPAADLARAASRRSRRRARPSRNGARSPSATGPCSTRCPPRWTRFRVALSEGVTIAAGAAAAAEAAEAGARATTGMEPTVGRAGWLKDRARGNEDPGARLVALAIAAAAGRVA